MRCLTAAILLASSALLMTIFSDHTMQAADAKGKKAAAANNIEKTDIKNSDDAKSETKEDTKMAGKIAVNDKAPDIALPDQHNKTVSLKDLRGKVVVLYFYPKDNTSVCTAEACTFRDSYEAFKDLGAEVIGISSDSVKSHQEFAEKNHLQFPLLADTSNMARKAFGVPNTAGIIPGRVTYVIDREGVVRYLFNSMMDGPKHVSEAMKIVKELCNNKS